MSHIPQMPELALPTSAVRESFLAGEHALSVEEGSASGWLVAAGADFQNFVDQRRQTREMWGVPTTERWYISGEIYIGTVIVRHKLTPELRREGGHIGYHVVPQHRRQGHATAMLAAARTLCRERDMRELHLTCNEDNTGSRRVIEVNGGILQDIVGGICRYRMQL